MNIYKFLNSRDEIKYLKQIKYCFTPLLSSFLIWNSINTTLQEKLSTWRELIDTTQDFLMTNRHNEYVNDMIRNGLDNQIPFKAELHDFGFHEFLSGCVAEVESDIADFYNGANGIYAYKYFDSPEVGWTAWRGYYSDSNKAYEEFKVESAELDDGASDSMGKSPRVRYSIVRHTIDEHLDAIYADFNEKGMARIKHSGKRYRFNRLFEQMWFDVPTPFKVGDVLLHRHFYTDKDDVFVVGGAMPNWGKVELQNNGVDSEKKIQEAVKLLERFNHFGDKSDMSIFAYYVRDDGTIYHNHPTPYFDMEYYKGELKGNLAVLGVVSKYLKGQSDLQMLLWEYDEARNTRRI